MSASQPEQSQRNIELSQELQEKQDYISILEEQKAEQDKKVTGLRQENLAIKREILQVKAGLATHNVTSGLPEDVSSETKRLKNSLEEEKEKNARLEQDYGDLHRAFEEEQRARKTLNRGFRCIRTGADHFFNLVEDVQKSMPQGWSIFGEDDENADEGLGLGDFTDEEVKDDLSKDDPRLGLDVQHHLGAKEALPGYSASASQQDIPGSLYGSSPSLASCDLASANPMESRLIETDMSDLMWRCTFKDSKAHSNPFSSVNLGPRSSFLLDPPPVQEEQSIALIDATSPVPAPLVLQEEPSKSKQSEIKDTLFGRKRATDKESTLPSFAEFEQTQSQKRQTLETILSPSTPSVKQVPEDPSITTGESLVAGWKRIEAQESMATAKARKKRRRS